MTKSSIEIRYGTINTDTVIWSKRCIHRRNRGFSQPRQFHPHCLITLTNLSASFHRCAVKKLLTHAGLSECLPGLGLHQTDHTHTYRQENHEPRNYHRETAVNDNLSVASQSCRLWIASSQNNSPSLLMTWIELQASATYCDTKLMQRAPQWMSSARGYTSAIIAWHPLYFPLMLAAPSCIWSRRFYYLV